MSILHTADLYDTHGESLRILQSGLLSYGGKECFHGPIETIQTYEDNSHVAKLLATPGMGRVLVVDGGGSLGCALLGDRLAGLAVKNGWAGVVVHGAIRDAAQILKMDLGVKALGTMPRKSVKLDRGEVSKEVEFFGVRMVPGDWLYADADGVLLSSRKLN